MEANKTGRIYGAVYQTILEFAKAKGAPFSPNDLCPPFDRHTAQVNIIGMVKAGHLVRVTPGKMGRYGHPATYALKPTATADKTNE